MIGLRSPRPATQQPSSEPITRPKEGSIMPVDPNARVEISAFSWVPSFAQGLVRDLRVRWALEEAGLPYRERLLDARSERPEDYFREQPFGQVPIYVEGDIRMFESGAIVLHIAERAEALMPRDPAGRARTSCWVFAALNSVEPAITELANIDIFNADAEWARARRPGAEARVRNKLDRLSAWLGERDYLEDRFTAGDLMMAAVLRILRHTDLVAEHPALARYQARCEARPAFRRALRAQLAHFEKNASAAAA
jgi:glutathione S-transferase